MSKFSLILFFLIPLSLQANETDLELGRDLMDCAVLRMKLANTNADPDEGQKSAKTAYTLMLIQTSTLIPRESLEAEWTNAQKRFVKAVSEKASEKDSEIDILAGYLTERLLACRQLEAEKGRDAYMRGMEAMMKKSDQE